MKPVEKDKMQREKTGAIIRQLRSGLHWSQSELAEKLLVTRSAVNQWENGKTMPSQRNLRELASIFNVSFDSLMGVTSSSFPGVEAGVLTFLESVKALNAPFGKEIE